jgi:hypothetical protein
VEAPSYFALADTAIRQDVVDDWVILIVFLLHLDSFVKVKRGVYLGI